jgi:TolB-like protein/Tfp pilus assembly protein PilF
VKWVRRNPINGFLAASLIALTAAAGWMIAKSDFGSHTLTTGIAVLPFENLSDDKEPAFFADGLQDDILSKLGKIADLKVISRGSVAQYRGKQDVREIGNALRVSHVLEGTVRRSGGKVHVNAQLVDTRSNQNIWADEYDRNLNDVFVIESEVAESIASRLRTKLSVPEKAAMEERPTRDLVAYDLYVHATSLIDASVFLEAKEQEDHLSHAAELLNQAIGRDPSFLQAYCRLAEAHDELYFDEFDRTSSRLELAKSAIDSAFRLKPDSGEAHFALGRHLYHGYREYDRARDELTLAVRTLPNNARIFEWLGYIDRHQNRWDDAVRNFEHAMELDPRNVRIVTMAAGTYHLLLAYQSERVALDRLLALEPDNIRRRLQRAQIDLRERADTRATHAVLDKIRTDNLESADARLDLAFYEHDAAAAEGALAKLQAMGQDSFIPGRGAVVFSMAYELGLVARMKGDTAGAHAAFTTARVEQEKIVQARPDYGPPLCVLGLIDAGLGRKEEALREGRLALELTPMTNNPFDRADMLYCYGVICAWSGERELAIQQVETLAKIVAGPSYGDLRLSPNWDSLRGDPRFEEILASFAPK